MKPHVEKLMSVADPGFPRGGGANPEYYLTNCSRNLHENKSILAQTGGGGGAVHTSLAPLSDLPLCVRILRLAKY